MKNFFVKNEKQKKALLDKLSKTNPKVLTNLEKLVGGKWDETGGHWPETNFIEIKTGR